MPKNSMLQTVLQNSVVVTSFCITVCARGWVLAETQPAWMLSQALRSGATVHMGVGCASGSRTRLTHHNTQGTSCLGTPVCGEVSSWSICYTFGCFYVNNENIEGITRGVWLTSTGWLWLLYKDKMMKVKRVERGCQLNGGLKGRQKSLENVSRKHIGESNG